MYSISNFYPSCPYTYAFPFRHALGLSDFIPPLISVTYFVTYGTAMACYAYFVLTKQEYLFKEASDRQYLLNFYKRAQGREQMDAVI